MNEFDSVNSFDGDEDTKQALEYLAKPESEEQLVDSLKSLQAELKGEVPVGRVKHVVDGVRDAINKLMAKFDAVYNPEDYLINKDLSSYTRSNQTRF